MPCTVKDWIKTPAGYRRLHCDELAKGLGVDRTITSDPTMIPARMLDDLVGEHLWETIFAQVGELLSSTPQASTPTTEPPPMETPSPDNEERFSSVEGKWEWKPPNLSLNSAFYKRSLRSLQLATKQYPKELRAEIIVEGKRDLANHRRNYGPDGPQHLQILWWRMPQEHWETL